MDKAFEIFFVIICITTLIYIFYLCVKYTFKPRKTTLTNIEVIEAYIKTEMRGSEVREIIRPGEHLLYQNAIDNYYISWVAEDGKKRRSVFYLNAGEVTRHVLQDD